MTTNDPAIVEEHDKFDGWGPPRVTLRGLNAHVSAFVEGLARSIIVPAKPFWPETVIAEDAGIPKFTGDGALAPIAKSCTV